METSDILTLNIFSSCVEVDEIYPQTTWSIGNNGIHILYSMRFKSEAYLKYITWAIANNIFKFGSVHRKSGVKILRKRSANTLGRVSEYRVGGTA